MSGARTWFGLGAFYGFLSVAMGAFGAHALKSSLSAGGLAVYQTGAQYQMYHALALLAVGILAFSMGPAPALRVAGWAFSVGIVLFSGSLYALALTDIKILGAITPLGGLSFMVGWLSLVFLAVSGARG